MRNAACLLLLVSTLGACAVDGGSVRPAVVAAVPPPSRSSTETVRDDALKAAVQRRLAELDRRAFRAVQVEAWQGRVLLMGAVIKPEHRRKAEQAAKTADGATTILNELVLAEDRAFDLFADDPARAEQVRRAVGGGPAIRVVGGVAFLLGAAASAEQARQMKADALDVDGIKWAVAHLTTP